jgi:PLD-like domain
MAAKSSISDGGRPGRGKRRSEGYLDSIKESQEIARKNDDFPGYKASACLSLGYPILKVDATVALTLKKRLPTIDEMILRLIDLETGHAKNMASFLGIDVAMVEDHASRLSEQEQIRRFSDKDGAYYELMTAGRIAVCELQVSHSRTESCALYIDAESHKISGINKGGVSVKTILPKTCRERGIELLLDGSDLEFPKAHEIDIAQLEKQLNAATRGRPKQQVAKNVQCITEMSGYQTRYLPIHVVIYEPELSGEPTYKLIYDGPSKLDIKDYLEKSWWPTQKHLFVPVHVERDAIDELTKELADGTGATSREFLKAEEREKEIETRISEKSASLAAVTKNANDEEIEALRKELEMVREEKAQALKAAETLERSVEEAMKRNLVRVLEWHEHYEILSQAIKGAQRRLLIVSPWIRSRIIDDVFYYNLKTLLGNGVMIRIMYGMPFDDRHDGQQSDRSAIDDLLSLQKNGDIQIQDLSSVGGTHEKILIRDSDYFISTSHNWLSYAGKKSSRRETGTIVTDIRIINPQWDKYMKIFDEARHRQNSGINPSLAHSHHALHAPPTSATHGKFPRR